MRPPTTDDVDGILVIALDDPDHLNDGRSDRYRQALYETIEGRSRPRVAIDLGPVDFLSSTGLVALIGMKKRVEAAKGSIVLFALHPHLQDILRVTRLDRFVTVVPDRASALGRLAGSKTL